MSRLREYIAEANPDAVLLEGPEFDAGIIGLSCDDSRVIYSYERIVEALVKQTMANPIPAEEEPLTLEEAHEQAEEWVNYNTLRAIPYMGENAPIIIFELPPENDTDS